MIRTKMVFLIVFFCGLAQEAFSQDTIKPYLKSKGGNYYHHDDVKLTMNRMKFVGEDGGVKTKYGRDSLVSIYISKKQMNVSSQQKLFGIITALESDTAELMGRRLIYMPNDGKLHITKDSTMLHVNELDVLFADENILLLHGQFVQTSTGYKEPNGVYENFYLFKDNKGYCLNPLKKKDRNAMIKWGTEVLSAYPDVVKLLEKGLDSGREKFNHYEAIKKLYFEKYYIQI